MNAPQDGKFMIRDIIVYTYIIDSTDLLLYKRIPFFVIFSFLKKQIKRELLYLENTVFLGTTIFFFSRKTTKNDASVANAKKILTVTIMFVRVIGSYK